MLHVAQLVNQFYLPRTLVTFAQFEGSTYGSFARLSAVNRSVVVINY